jgi:hypothetical protein
MCCGVFKPGTNSNFKDSKTQRLTVMRYLRLYTTRQRSERLKFNFPGFRHERTHGLSAGEVMLHEDGRPDRRMTRERELAHCREDIYVARFGARFARV